METSDLENSLFWSVLQKEEDGSQSFSEDLLPEPNALTVLDQNCDANNRGIDELDELDELHFSSEYRFDSPGFFEMCQTDGKSFLPEEKQESSGAQQQFGSHQRDGATFDSFNSFFEVVQIGRILTGEDKSFTEGSLTPTLSDVGEKNPADSVEELHGVASENKTSDIRLRSLGPIRAKNYPEKPPSKTRSRPKSRSKLFKRRNSPVVQVVENNNSEKRQRVNRGETELSIRTKRARPGAVFTRDEKKWIFAAWKKKMARQLENQRARVKRGEPSRVSNYPCRQKFAIERCRGFAGRFVLGR
jgi:hypothetical protein